MRRRFSVILIVLLLFLTPVIVYAESGDTIVHRTKTGYAYHIANCYHLRSDIEISLREAYEDGLSPCEDCNPPELDESEKTAIVAEKQERSSVVSSTSELSEAERAALAAAANRKTRLSAIGGTKSSSNSKSRASTSTSSTPPAILEINSTSEKHQDPYQLLMYIATIGITAALGEALYFICYKNRVKKQNNTVKSQLNELKKEIAQQKTTIQKYQNQVEQFQQLTLKLQHDKERLADKELFENIFYELSAIPDNVKFIENGLPYDAATNGKYGSFTIYYSKNGTKYHKKKGCSGANQEAHIIDAVNHYYTPCRNCCKESFKIPGWYKAYKTLFDLLK